MSAVPSHENRQIRLAVRPSGLPRASDWKLTIEPVPVPGPSEFVVAVEYVSIDPAMRRWIAETAFDEPVAIGDVMEAGAIGRVQPRSTPGSRWGITSTVGSESRSSLVPMGPA